MDSYEATVHPFRIKIWLEETSLKRRGASWRGSIVHIPSGRQGIVEDLDGIVDFVAPYLEGMGVRLGPAWWVRRRLRAWRMHSRRNPP